MAVRLIVDAVVNGQRRIDALRASLTGVRRQSNGVGRALTAAFSIVAVTRFANAITESSDAIIGIQNQLRAAGVSTEGIAAAQEDVVRLSEQSRSSLEATGGLYARVLRSTRELGISQREGLDITRAFQQSLALSGASAQEAAAASLQFGQALASGRLQGDELRSILENNSFFAQMLAAELGVGVGRLREMGAEGLLTSETLANVALNIGPEIQAQFEQLQPTFAQAAVLLRNRLTLAFTELGMTIQSLTGNIADFARGIGDTLANAIRRVNLLIQALRDNADGLQTILIATAATITTILLPAVVRLAAAIALRLASAILLVLSPIGLLVIAVSSIATIGIVAFDQLSEATSAVGVSIGVTVQRILNFFDSLPDRAIVAAAGFAESFVAGLDDVGEAIINALLIPINGVIERANDLGAGLSLLSVDIPELTLDIDTSEAEAALEEFDSVSEMLAAQQMAANQMVSDSFGAVGDRIEMAYQEGIDTLAALQAAFTTPLEPQIESPDMTAMNVVPPEDMEAAQSEFQMLLQGVFSFDGDELSELSEDFRSNLENGFSRALNSGDFSSLGDVFLNSFTMSVNDQLAMGLSDLFGGLFENITMMGEGMTTGILDLFGNLFSGIADMLSGLFGGGGGGGGLGGLFSAGLGLFGFQEGGIVPGPQGPGPDNTIAAVRSGELILNRAQQDNLAQQLQQQPMTINQTVQVTGNVDEATRRAVREMGNEITNSVQQRFNERGLLR